MSSKKRKNRRFTHSSQAAGDTETASPTEVEQQPFVPDPMLFLQAHEADLVRGPHASLTAQSLEVKRTASTSPATGSKERPLKIGDALIRWNTGLKITAFPMDDEEFGQPSQAKDDEDEGIWVDRYDARLLLDALPPRSKAPDVPPDSPSGWSDLPSDSEDTFFFSPDEAEDYHRDKRRRLIEKTREERLKARREEDGESEEEEPDVWGGSDEEPDETHKELMRRTAKHLLTSPNPAQLEMRILANHGGDNRFAFLRGRWSRAWKVTKGKARLEKDEEEKTKAPGLGVLAGYASDSDSADNEEDEGPGEKVSSDPPVQADVEEVSEVSEDAAKDARRLRAKEWAEKRRALKESAAG